MITLNGTPGNNNEVIWVLKLFGESGNVITYGDFSSSSGWTTGGDWTISGGVANYTYTYNSSGTLSRTITTTSSEYIFSYEVVERSGSGFSLKLDSSFGIIAADLDLDLTLGKHTYSIQCNGGSNFKLTVSGMGLEDYLIIDNVSLKLADNITYIASRDIALTNTYDGKVLNKNNPFSPVSWNSTIQNSGGAGAVTSYSISISRHVSNSNLDGFFDEFAPASTGGNLTGRVIDLGIAWSSASADTGISWLLRGRIIEYSYTPRTLDIVVFQESEIQNKEIPYYAIQKDFDNDMSYFVNYINSYGKTIPVVYGAFDGVYDEEYFEVGLYKLSPCIPVNSSSAEFIIASHPCYETSADVLSSGNAENLFKYIDGVESYLRIYNSDSANSTTYNTTNCRFKLINIRGGYLAGLLYIKLVEPSNMTDVTDDDGAVDFDITTYSELDAVAAGDNRLALRTVGSASTSEVGILGVDDLDIRVSFRLSTDGGGNRNYTINYYNNNLLTPAGDSSPTTGTLTSSTSTIRSHTFGANTDGKEDTTIPWKIEEICGLDFYVENDQTISGQKIRVYSAFLALTNIRVYARGGGVRERYIGGRGI